MTIVGAISGVYLLGAAAFARYGQWERVGMLVCCAAALLVLGATLNV